MNWNGVHEYIENEIQELLTREEDLKVDEFHICSGDYIAFEIVINQFNDLRKEYREIQNVEEMTETTREELIWDRVIRGCMLLSGLILYVYEEG